MAGIVIVGNGVAGTTAAFAARERDPRIDITLVADESDYFFSRTALMYAFMDRLERRALEPFEREVYGRKRIRRLRDRVVELDATGRTLRLRDHGPLSYEGLLLATGSAPRRLPAAGLEEARDGVVSFVTLDDLDRCERLTPSTRRAVVVGGGLIGVELVECLRHHGRQVTFLVREPWYFPAALAREEARMVESHLRARGVDVRTGDELEAVETDATGRVARVRTRAGEAIDCELLGIAVGVEPQVDWLRSVLALPALGRGVLVDDGLRSSLSGVWAAGDCAEIGGGPDRPGLVEQLWYSARRQGELAGRNLTGAGERYRPPLFFNSARFFEIEYTTVGEVAGTRPGRRSLYRRHPGKDISQRMVVEDGAVVGFNMLGSRWDHAVLSRWIEEHRGPGEVLARLHEAQFDVELGRVPLGEMRETDVAVSGPGPAPGPGPGPGPLG